MKIKGYIWLDHIVDKLYDKHGVVKEEVRELFSNKPRIQFAEKGNYPNENVYFATGQTFEGRYLIIFFVRKRDGTALILSARDMTRAERRRHGRK